jgi:hypothetical protein
MGLARLLNVLLAVGSLLIVIGSIRAGHAADRTPVYTVAALRTHLAQDPEAWVNRPLRVRALAEICSTWLGSVAASPCIDTQPVLADPAPTGVSLPLAWGSAPPVVAFLRRLPLLSAVVPAAQAPRWGALAVYRVQVRALTCGPAQPPCYEALLLDAKTSTQV